MTTKKRVSNAAHVLLTHCVTTHAHRPTVDEQPAVIGDMSWKMSTPALAWLKSK
jgi:hypothetical protein